LNEKLIERKLVNKVKSLKGECLKFIPTYANGFPDRIIIMPGDRIWFVELKTTGKTLDPLQALWRDRLIKLGCRWRFIDDAESLQKFINEIT
jgi:hypothetical protein